MHLFGQASVETQNSYVLNQTSLGMLAFFFNTKDLFETSLYEVWKVIVLRIVDGSP